MATALRDAELKSACCRTWTNPIALLLVGDRLHPGGERTTALTVDFLKLEPGARVLDVGCGYGSTLRLLEERGYVPIGLDLAPEAAISASSIAGSVIADAEHPPIRDGSLDGIVMECVLSLLPDKRTALSRAHKALKVGGRISVSDVTLERPLPLPLQELTMWSTCVGGALPTAEYVRVLHEVGYAQVDSIPLDHELIALIDQIRRRIALIEIALTARGVELSSLGLDRNRLEALRRLAVDAVDLIRDGGAGYRLFHATKQ